MLAYAPRPNDQRLSRGTLTLIILGHAGLLAVVMTAKSGIIPANPFTPTEITFVPTPEVPTPPPPPQPQTHPQPTDSRIDVFPPIVTDIPAPGPTFEQVTGPTIPSGPVAGTGDDPIVHEPSIDPPIIRTGPRLATLGDAIRPPYPDSMRQNGDEASLRLRLTIDERGRVTSVEPVGAANPTFLAAARRHILRVWRYQPAMEGSKAVPSTTTITLKFELGNA